MDRFEWTNDALMPREALVKQQHGVRLYDGNQKTQFDHGIAVLTTHRLMWKDMQGRGVLAFHLSLVIYVEKFPDPKGKGMVVVHLNAAPPNKNPGPVMSSSNTYIKLGCKEGGEEQFFACLTEQLSRKLWQFVPASQQAKPTAQPRSIHKGIVGIERKLEEKRKETDTNIDKAFEDLGELMKKAKDMVDLTKTIANKIKEKQGEITEDETVKFKSYLLSLGIANPVTRETHGSGLKYHEELAKQLSEALIAPVEESGGMMAITDVYCRINRARGMELLSPDDLIDACQQFERLRLPLRLRRFTSGVLVLESLSKGEEAAIEQTAELIVEKASLSADELAQIAGVSVMLAKGRLLAAEEVGKACRDESVEGLRFFPNLFLNPPSR
ncbi:vacuolar protein-sorting-associated protein 36 [Strongylocentrotus purpuratus]|uniref:Vacuolar protein-sorting-associated protein 36 n=1 Tax=Strongylocentrotus purpuratus TaxID=7668 RepID=A0A7M7NHP3_STRPU|nr:vacuolar protein-sorting-associated protein 36 [Strongylocentrotus purpuratus]